MGFTGLGVGERLTGRSAWARGRRVRGLRDAGEIQRRKALGIQGGSGTSVDAWK